MVTTRLKTTCCIAGGGPAGLMLGLLLARNGVPTLVLEKHADFLRDFRGDTIHPSTMEVMHELGLLDEFLRLPHQKVPNVVAQFADERLEIANFSRLPVHAPYVAMMPQWDFLSFLAEKAEAFPSFQLMRRTEALDLIRSGGRIIGLRSRTPEQEIEIEAELTVAADGRGSRLREAACLPLVDLGAPMDVLWFRLSRKPGDTDQTQGRFDAGGIFVMLNRGDYWQCAYVIPKGANDRIRNAGLGAFREKLAKLLPIDPSRAGDLGEWEQVKLLVVQVNRVERWWLPGFLCIGDAAHAMSPVGGVGVNLAIQDAVAAANVVVEPLRRGRASDADLAAVQRRREWPTKATQRLQVVVQQRIIASALAATGAFRPPLALRLIARTPLLNRLPARGLGLGLRSEHVAGPLRSVRPPAATSTA